MKTKIKSALSLFRNDASKWLIVFSGLLLFAGIALPPLHEQPVYVGVGYIVCIWAILVLLTFVISRSARKANNDGAPRDKQ